MAYRKGDWKVIDQESGLECYASEVVRDWRGLLVRKRWADTQHPQDFIKPKPDKVYADFVSKENPPDCVPLNPSPYVGATTTPREPAPADSILKDGIGSMTIGCDFYVE